MSFNLKGIGDFFTGNEWDLDGLGDGTSTFGGSDAVNSFANSYPAPSSTVPDDFFTYGGSNSFANSYPAPSSMVPDDFFTYSPDKYSGIDWNKMIANPDVLEGVGDSYPDLFKNGVDFLKDFTGSSDREPTNLAAVKKELGLPTDKSKDSWYSHVPGTNVGFYGGGGSSWQDTNALLGQVRANTPRNMGVGTPGGIRIAGQGLDIHDIARMGAGFAQGKLTDLALGAVPGIGTALVIANKLHPDGVVGVAKDVGRFAGDVFGGIAKGAGGIVKGLTKWLCDERLKVDIAPLESTEVNDELAQMAFFVKGLRECS